VLRARRRLAASPSAWPLSSAGLDTLQGKAPDPVALTAALADKASHASARALNALVYDPDCDETVQIEQWRDIVKETRTLPPPRQLPLGRPARLRDLPSAGLGGLVARHLCISSTAARDLIRTFDLHEMTGRQRYRAWSIL
jgi:hypothetical protein